MQNIPVVPDPVQAVNPQMQGVLSAVLGAKPSVILQAEAVVPAARNVPSLLQVLSAAMQNIPVVVALSQSADPHLQLPPSFAEVPSVVLQDANTGREQVLDAAVQTIPVPCPLPLLVQAVVPQMQGVLSAVLGAEPSVILQAGVVRVHMQVLEIEHDVVEDVFLLKYREPPEYM